MNRIDKRRFLLHSANVRLTGIMQKSSEIAHSLSELMKVEQFQSVSQEFSKELMKVIEDTKKMIDRSNRFFFSSLVIVL